MNGLPVEQASPRVERGRGEFSAPSGSNPLRANYLQFRS